ncbi:uncharacterized protein TNCT_532641 [Trichonephila clavata]|uniref:Uncharacterized protein n=1 Tax=Trichonephila clavata TaxID=2740835 RepID=A0A8X6G0A9_TRICU|nr:uncharacterized protein TNCT_532641 [Trichonephila clavata]
MDMKIIIYLGSSHRKIPSIKSSIGGHRTLERPLEMNNKSCLVIVFGRKYKQLLLLKFRWMQLPPNVQSILASIQPLTAQKASEVADRILEVTPAQVSAVSIYIRANSDDCSESELLKELKFLRQEVKELRRSRSFSRNRFNSRNRGKSPKPTVSNLCWYHYKFAAKARKCIQPCSFQENINGQE